MNMSADEFKETVAEIASEAHKPSVECLPLDMQLPDDKFKKPGAGIASDVHKVERH